MLLKRLSTSAEALSGALQQCRAFHDRSKVPRVVDDREKRMHKVHDIGYVFRYHRKGVDPLPRIPENTTPVHRPKVKQRDAWRESQAHFGENDCIDLLGNGRVHPAQLQYHVPRWLRGFPGRQRAIEPVKLIHYRNLYDERLKADAPWRWHQLQKRISYLLQYHNYQKSDEMHDERALGLWEEEPDFFFKDKSRRSYKDLI